ncbi:hypothetical protein ABZ714_26685 [Streptomyces sp. NPDC006798]|uniref:hypothetical protein n=1 Tax=Streptomyces sp. NPDC006798 TaxID=3155462 RepID=UPI00340882AD
MDDPVPPSDPAGPVGDAGLGAALATVDLVLAWYTRRILEERRASTADPRRLAELLARRTAGVRDRNRLAEADPAEVARLGRLYAERLKELEERGTAP